MSFYCTQIGALSASLLHFTNLHPLIQNSYEIYIIIVMFLEEFEQSLNRSHKMKKIRKEYSAGFKNYHPEKHIHQDSKDTFENSQDDIFSKLKIGNLKELYLSSQPQIDNRKIQAEEQMKSINRLVSHPERKNKTENQIQESVHQNREQLVQKFMQTYHKTEHFQDRATLTLFKGQFKKLKQKLQYKHKRSKPKQQFSQTFLKFIIIKYESLNKKLLKEDELINQFNNFLNQNLKITDQNVKKQSINVKSFKQFIKKNIFLYGFFNLGRLQIQQPNLEIGILRKAIRTDMQFKDFAQNSQFNDLVDKKYTIPYQSHLCKSNIKIEKHQPQQTKVIFQANLIPKTTYTRPQQRPKSHISKTNPNPFNLSQGNQKDKITMNQYYQWDRTFHAGVIPQTTYTPNLIYTLDDKQKKLRQKELLKLSVYPSNMNYLSKYDAYIQQKEQKLQQKYHKNHQSQNNNQHKIPDFDRIHHNDVIQLQNLKAQNRNTTKPVPFNLSQSKPRKDKTQNRPLHDPKYIQPEVQNNLQTKSKPRHQPVSTLKYQAYVNHRKRLKQQEITKKEEEKIKQNRQQSNKKEYKNILKQRVQDELNRVQKKAIVQQPLASNLVKVDLEKIYTVQPLLIERQSAKNKPVITPQNNWIPII